MLPTSHEVQTRFPPPASPELLAEAFSDFISASARLELSYRDLQGEVQQLSHELADRNLALEASLAENREMRQSLEQILDSMPCGVLVVEGDGEIRLANPEAARLLALPESQLNSLAAVQAARGIDLSLGHRDLAEDAPEQELALHAAAAGPASAPSADAPTTRWLAVRRRSLQGPASLAHHGADAVIILRDVSARRRIEAEREAARSAVALAEVAAMLAHEIRNPLASMELFAGLLAEPSPKAATAAAQKHAAVQKHAVQKHTAERAEWVSHLRAGIRSLSGTVNNVLTLHGGAPPPLERLELEHELALAVDFLAPLARQARVTVHLASAPGEQTGSTAIRANKNALHQMILNLCSNALRHTPAGGCVTLSVEHNPQRHDAAATHPGRIAVHVADTGCGIPPEYLSQLFHGRFSGSGSSPGLGLAVCARLMRQHGGAISVRSQTGLGSTFTLEFPAL